MSRASVDGVELHYEVAGEGEPLLLIQGMSGTHRSWGEPFLAALHGAGLQTAVYDHRGIGHSSPQTEPFALTDLAVDAVGLLDALGWESAHVMGISMGGMVAQELALRAPERIRTLTLGCTYAGGPEGAMLTPEDMQFLTAAMTSGDRERALRAGYTLNVSQAFAGDPAHWDPFLAMATSVPAPLPTIMLQMQAIGAHDTSARLAQVSAPTLVIHGTEDRMLPVANGRFIARTIPGARLEELEGVGHMFWWERPEQTAALVAEHARAGAAA